MQHGVGGGYVGQMKFPGAEQAPPYRLQSESPLQRLAGGVGVLGSGESVGVCEAVDVEVAVGVIEGVSVAEGWRVTEAEAVTVGVLVGTVGVAATGMRDAVGVKVRSPVVGMRNDALGAGVGEGTVDATSLPLHPTRSAMPSRAKRLATFMATPRIRPALVL